MVARRAGVDAPIKPDPKKPGSGGRRRTRLFAYWIDQGVTAYEAYIKAGFPVRGVKGPSGELWETGPSIKGAQASAERLAKSPRIQGWIAAWNVPPESLLEQLKAESIGVLMAALRSKDGRGQPSARAVNAADSILDRTGLGRGSKVALEHHRNAQGAVEMDELRKQLIEAMRREGMTVEVAARRVAELEGGRDEN